MRHCEPEHPDAHDKNQLAAPDISAGQQDALFGAVAELFGAVNLPALPLYGTPDHCNARGLTTLGEHTIAGLAKRHMLFDPDHMSVKARNAALDQVEEMEYPGILSSHSWSTEDAYPRIYELGGYIAPYAGDSTGFVEKWRKHLGWADPRYYFGFGYGADMNGLGAQGNPRGADVPNPVEYPFTGMGGVTVDKQRAGERVYDINVDGVAQYGLYPDWIEDLRQVAGGADGDRDRRRHGPRRGGLPPDLGAGRGDRARLLPQPRAAQEREPCRVAGPPRHDDPTGDGGGRPALHPARQPLHVLREDRHEAAGRDHRDVLRRRPGDRRTPLLSPSDASPATSGQLRRTS